MNDQLLGRLFEKAEMDTAIDAHLLEVRMGSEVIVVSRGRLRLQPYTACGPYRYTDKPPSPPP